VLPVLRSNKQKFKIMNYSPILTVITIALFLLTVYQVNADDKSAAAIPQVPGVPELPTGPITDNTVDCVNSKFFKIQKENPQLKTWLLDVQSTVEKLFAVRQTCDKEAKKIQAECVSTWNRSAGVQFLRLGLSLFEQRGVTGNPLEILNTFVRDFQMCW